MEEDLYGWNVGKILGFMLFGGAEGAEWDLRKMIRRRDLPPQNCLYLAFCFAYPPRCPKQEAKAKSGRSDVRKITFKGNRTLKRRNVRVVESKGMESEVTKWRERISISFEPPSCASRPSQPLLPVLSLPLSPRHFIAQTPSSPFCSLKRTRPSQIFRGSVQFCALTRSSPSWENNIPRVKSWLHEANYICITCERL